MAKSFIKSANKFKPLSGQIEAVAEAAHQYVQNWTRVEAQKMAQRDLVILPTSWGLQVGKYAVKNIARMWHVYNCFDELVDAFTCRQSAVTYCILHQTNKFNLARKLQLEDTRLSKLTQDQFNYAGRRIKAIKNKDTLVVDVIDARLSETNSLISLAQNDLEKTLNKAKYLKGIWEQPL